MFENQLKTAEDRLSVTLEYLKRNGDWELGIDDPTTNILREVIISNGVEYEWLCDSIAMKWMEGIDHSQLLYQQGMR
jgi:hypothetical protein